LSRNNRAISPVIATVIILAVTVAVSIAVLSYITGIWGATAGGKPILHFMPDSYINVSDRDFANRPAPSLHLHVANKGIDATIEKIVVKNVEIRLFYLLDHDTSLKTAYRETRGAMTRIVPSGSDAWIIADLSGFNPVPGTVYTIEVYTKNGDVYKVPVVAKG